MKKAAKIVMLAILLCVITQVIGQVPTSLIQSSKQFSTDGRITAIETDSHGNVYYTGSFTDSLGWMGNVYYAHPPQAPIYYSRRDIFLAKVNHSGALEWFKVIGDKGDDLPTSLVIDNKDDIVIAGTMWDTVDFGGKIVSGVEDDGFVAKYDGAGSLKWAVGGGDVIPSTPTYQRYTNEDLRNSFAYQIINDIACDSQNNIYMAGSLSSGIFADSVITGGGNRFFVGKLDSAGVLQWSRTGTATSAICTFNRLYGITILSDGNILSVGSSQCDVGGDGACTSYSAIGGGKNFMKRNAPNGECILLETESPYSGGSSWHNGYYKVKASPSGNFYTLGFNSYTTSSGAHILLLKKHNAAGAVAWSKWVSYPYSVLTDQLINTLEVDKYENIYVGSFRTILKFDSAGTLLWTQHIDSSDIHCIKVANNGTMYISGRKPGRMFFTVGKDFTYGNSHSISGFVFGDRNNNCLLDNTEGLNVSNVVKIMPGNYYIPVNSNGFYTGRIDTGATTITPLVEPSLCYLIKDTCTPSLQLNIPLPYTDTTGINFGYKYIPCSYLRINMDVPRLRRCTANSGRIDFSNIGDADATNVSVVLKMPANVILTGASHIYSLLPDSTYLFSIGTVAAHTQQYITLELQVPCIPLITGLSQCFDVMISPKNLCTDTINPAAQQWDRSELVVKSSCNVLQQSEFIIYNYGQSMEDSTIYRLFINGGLFQQGHIKLAAGDSVLLTVAQAGYYVHCEVNQATGYPFDSVAVAFAVNCGSTAPNAFIANIPSQVPPHDENAVHDVECTVIRDSYDPNDKAVSPSGFTDEHIVPQQQRLTYTIRFQNTGNDTAYRVILIDTISEHLNLETLRPISSSHDFTWSIEPTNVLLFDFKNINLVDSATNPTLSNGYVKFSITPYNNLPARTVVHNLADIYFDYNTPVRTNFVDVTLFDTTYIFTAPVSSIADEKNVVAGLVPNPFTNELVIKLSDDFTTYPVWFELYDMVGRKMLEQQIVQPSQKIQTGNIPSGIFIGRIRGAGTTSYRLLKL